MEKFRWAYCLMSGEIYISEPMDFDTAYEVYCDAMAGLRGQGLDLGSMQWRGVFTGEELAGILSVG